MVRWGLIIFVLKLEIIFRCSHINCIPVILKSSDRPTGVPVPAGLCNGENISGVGRLQAELTVRDGTLSLAPPQRGPGMLEGWYARGWV